MTRPSSALLLLVAAVLGGCAGPSQYLKPADGVWLRYERTPCFGPCPAFLLEVDAEGRARFHGRRHATPEGQHEAQWDAATLRGIAEAAHQVSLRNHAGTYDNPMVTDLPAKRLTLGATSLIDRMDGPPIGAFYDHLDSLIARTPWVPSGL